MATSKSQLVVRERQALPAVRSTRTAVAKRKPLPVFKAPADFKPHFLLVQVTTEKDGLIGCKIKATRYQGRFDREAEDKKKFDISTYDPVTLVGIAARLSGVTYKATNDKKLPVDPKDRVNLKGAHRLCASTTFQLLMRVGKRAADQSLTCGVKQIWQALANNKGVVRLKELEKTDPAYRALRKASRILPAAFAQVQMPPKRTRGAQNAE